MPEGIVLMRVSGVETDTRPLNAALPHLLGLWLAQQHAIGAEHHGKPFVGATGGQIENVFAEQRLASGQDQEDVGVGYGDVVDDPPTLLGGQLTARVSACEGAHVTVGAMQIAPLGQVP